MTVCSGAGPERSQGPFEAGILVGGQGTRLRPLLPETPKVLAPVAGRPFLTYLLDQLSLAGVGRVVLLTGYKAGVVEDALGDRYKDIELVYSRETAPLDTGGALRLSLPLFRGGTLFVLNGDSYLDASLQEFAAWRARFSPPAALMALQLSDTGRFGRLSVEADGHVASFDEKKQEGPGLINAGVYLFSREAVTAIPEGKSVSLEREVFPALCGKGLMAFPCKADFLDIGTPESYGKAETFFDRRNSFAR